MDECSFSKWYRKFSRYTIDSIPVPVPPEVLTYIQANGIILPKEADLPRRSRRDSYSSWTGSEDSDEEEQPTFPSFSDKLKDAMNQLGGEVFIKTNWSSPKDAAWIATNKSLKCSRLEDVYLLLKSSDIVANDFSHKFKEPEVDPDKTGYCVVLREWREINPSMEYRCYVMTNQIVAISQRNCNSYYDHIQASRHEILKDLVNFYRRRLHKKFFLETYTFDVIHEGPDDVTLVDLGPLDKSSAKTPLFTWEELLELSALRREDEDATAAADLSFSPEFRYLGEDPGIQPNQNQLHGVPYDISDLCRSGKSMSLIEHITEAVREQQRENDV